MQVTVLLTCTLPTRLLRMQNIDLNFRSFVLGHSSGLLPLIFEDCRFVDGATTSDSGKNLGIQFLSDLGNHSSCPAIRKGLHTS